MGTRRVGILTGGGDVPGLNVAIKAVTLRARNHDIEVIGLRRGWLSLLQFNPDDPASPDRWTMALPPDRVRTFDRTGGTILHTSRTNPSNVKPEDVPPFVRMTGRPSSALVIAKPRGRSRPAKRGLAARKRSSARRLPWGDSETGMCDLLMNTVGRSAR